MSATYTIKPIKVGSILYYRGAFNSNQDQYKEKEWFPVLTFLIEGNGHKIMVDTGCGNPAMESMKRCFHGPSEQLPDQVPDAALRKLGVDPSEIDTVILTHLHWDHSYNNQMFPNAQFYVQRKEMLYAISPAAKFNITYEAPVNGVVPHWLVPGVKWNIIDGDLQLFEGIRLVTLPGHSPGLQGVLVDTTDGQYLLPSDAIPLYDNFEDGTFRLSGLCANLDDFYTSFDKMKALGDKIIPSHDARVAEVSQFPAK